MVEQMRHTTIRTLATHRIDPSQKLSSNIDLAALPGQLASILVGALCAALGAASFGRLLLAGAGHEFAATGTAIILWGIVVTGLLIGVRSQFKGVLAGPQDLPAMLMSGTITSMMAASPAMPPQVRLGTAVTLVVVSTLATGIALFLLGRLRLGRLAAVVPDFAVGGLLAGTGWMLLQAVGGMTIPGLSSVADVARLMTPGALAQWGPVAGGALLILFVARRHPQGMALPATLMGLLILFALLQRPQPGTPTPALADGAPAHALLQAWHALPHADWQMIARHLPDIVAIAAVSVMLMLVHVRGLSLSLAHAVDLDEELKQTGTANLLAGMLGAHGGYHYVSDTLLIHLLGGGRRWVVAVIALGAGGALVAGETLLILFPTALLASLLGFVGLALLVEWLYARRSSLGRAQYVMMVAICVALAGWGLTTGFVVAVVASMLDYGWRRMMQ